MQYQFRNLTIQILSLELNANFNGLKGKITIEYLRVDLIQYSCEQTYLESLLKFKITRTIDFILQQNIDIIESIKKVECPENIIIRIKDGKFDWEKLALKILNGFCKFENSKTIQIFNQSQQTLNSPKICRIYNKISQFTQLKELSLPFSCETQAIENLMELLKSLKRLVHLNILSYESTTIIQDVVQELTQFAIDQLMELRTLKIYVHQAFEMRHANCTHRANPISISVTYVHKNGMVQEIDARSGKWNKYSKSHDDI